MRFVLSILITSLLSVGEAPAANTASVTIAEMSWLMPGGQMPPHWQQVTIASSDDEVGKSLIVERNVVDDCRMAFAEPVPRCTGIAIATDIDDAGERSGTWNDDIAFANQAKQTP